jgi:hypothetical protein
MHTIQAKHYTLVDHTALEAITAWVADPLHRAQLNHHLEGTVSSYTVSVLDWYSDDDLNRAITEEHKSFEAEFAQVVTELILE